MIRVLHSVSNMDCAGIETMLMNYYRHIDRTKVQFDFLVNKTKPGFYDEEIKKLGGRIFVSPGLNPIHYPEYIKFVDNIIKENPDIKIVHAHNEAMGLYALNGAKKAGIKVRIAHAHNTKLIVDYKWPIKIVCKQFLAGSATNLWGCGTDSGVYFFGKSNWNEKGMIMHNATELERFRYNEAVRKKIRSENGLEEKTVIGHVGRFNKQKNHKKIVSVFAEYKKLNQDSILVLIGEGELEQNTRELVKALGIEDSVIFAGQKSNVNEWYQAMDAFLMPSLFEGLPVVGVEAQASGVRCLFSDTITDEIFVSPFAFSAPLSSKDKVWAEKIDEVLKLPFMREEGATYVQKAGYDIIKETERIQNKYLSMVSEAYSK